METSLPGIVDASGNEIHVEVSGKEAILRGKDFLTRLSLEPAYGTRALQFSVIENSRSNGAVDIWTDSSVVIGNLPIESANRLIDQFAAAMSTQEQETRDVFGPEMSISSTSSQLPSLASIVSFLMVGAGIAVVALPVAGMARAGWELAVHYLR
ncbi:hypothetical protein [Chromobacterium haemolyticum]|uniref:hypothetical protein n=1 Tax=Chromobacterium haemolyticum TaxID=394935 RepID=UPI002449653A|nr:hypothetical protein [Chromobacterium haemolyticum]MDH0342044.1 hypothetical protein [Chromobacterium haemolyticum]